MYRVSREEMIKTISEFLELGHVENIVALFREEPANYQYTADLIQDERFIVRMGMVVLFEELAVVRPKEMQQALPSLLDLLKKELPKYVRGEVLTLLGIIGGQAAREELEKVKNGPDLELAEIARDYLHGGMK